MSKPKPPAGMPSKLTICGTTWTVEYLDNPRDSDGKVVAGATFGHARRIVIDSDAHPDVQRCTLLHEGMHAGLRLSGGRSLFGDDDGEERIIKLLELPMLSLIRDNKVKW